MNVAAPRQRTGPSDRPDGQPATFPDFSQSPFLVIWEVTRACDLACKHCRAEANPRRHPLELTTREGLSLLAEIRRFGRPVVVLTGGDPLKREDVLTMVREGTKLGLRMTMTPSGTPLMTPEVVRRLADAGLSRLAVSLDGSCAERHDAFRGVSGSFDLSVAMLREARRIGLSTQVNTSITRATLDDFDRVAALVGDLGISLWSVFFLVPVGRGKAGDEVSAQDFEDVFARMHRLSLTAPFDIKSTAAPHYRRYQVQQLVRMRREQKGIAPGARPGGGPVAPGTAAGSRTVGFSLADGVGRAARSVNDGQGLVFVSHTGTIYPSGFLPLGLGSVRTQSLVDVYRHHPIMRQLRDPDRLGGKCGMCRYRRICGGSRARSYAMTGDHMAAEPFCSYIPPAYQKLVDAGRVPAPGVQDPAQALESPALESP